MQIVGVTPNVSYGGVAIGTIAMGGYALGYHAFWAGNQGAMEILQLLRQYRLMSGMTAILFGLMGAAFIVQSIGVYLCQAVRRSRERLILAAKIIPIGLVFLFGAVFQFIVMDRVFERVMANDQPATVEVIPAEGAPPADQPVNRSAIREATTPSSPMMPSVRTVRRGMTPLFVHLNPIRTAAAEDVEAEELRQQMREYPWSSYGSIIGIRKRPSWLARDAVLRTWRTRVREQQREYAGYVESGLLKNVRDPLEAEAIQGILGSEGFLDRVRRLINLGADVLDARECGQARRLQATIPLERVIETVCRDYDISREEVLRRHNRDCEARQVLLYLASTCCRGRRTLTDLAANLGPISLGALTRAREKIQQRLAEDKRLRKRIEAVGSTLYTTQEDDKCKS